MKFEHIYGYYNFWEYMFQFAGDRIDQNATLVIPRSSFIADNTEYYCSTYYDTLENFNKLFGTDFLVMDSVFASKHYFTIARPDRNESIEPAKIASTPLEPEDIEEGGDILSLTVEDEAPVVETKQPDWDWIETLQNKKFDKIKLDEYIEEEFGIKLKRNMTLSNMIKDLKEQLNVT